MFWRPHRTGRKLEVFQDQISIPGSCSNCTLNYWLHVNHAFTGSALRFLEQSMSKRKWAWWNILSQRDIFQIRCACLGVCQQYFFLTLAVQRQCRREGSKTKEKLAQAQRKQTMWRHSSVRDRWPKYVKTRLSSNKQNLLLESACQPWKAMSSRKGGERGDRLSIIWSNAWRNWRRPLWRAECFRIE